MVVSSALVAVALVATPAAADPVPPTIGTPVETVGIGTIEPGFGLYRAMCGGSRSLTGLTAYRADTGTEVPVGGVEPTCSGLGADTGVVTLTDPQPGPAIGNTNGASVGVTECPLGAVVTGLRAALGVADIIVGLRVLCAYLNADGSLTPAPP